MTDPAWKLTETAARWLEPNEREAVLGDLEEAGLVSWGGLLEVAGLCARRQLAPWTSWRPWLAGLGIALPNSFLLMGNSLALTRALTQPHAATAEDLGQTFLYAFFVFFWAWSAGYAVGTLSRKTLWASTAMCFLPCLFCLSRFHHASLSRFSLLLFVLPALLGAGQSLMGIGIRRWYAIVLATAATCWMFTWSVKGGMWIGSWLLLWPIWLIAFQPHPFGTEAS